MQGKRSARLLGLLAASSSLLVAGCLHVNVSPPPDQCDDFTHEELDEMEQMEAVNAYPKVQRMIERLNGVCCYNADLVRRKRAGCEAEE